MFIPFLKGNTNANLCAYIHVSSLKKYTNSCIIFAVVALWCILTRKNIPAITITEGHAHPYTGYIFISSKIV